MYFGVILAADLCWWIAGNLKSRGAA